MAWLLYDDLDTGHHLPFLDVIHGELLARGEAPSVASAHPPANGADRWIPLDTVPHRAFVANYRQMRRVGRRARRLGADTLIDLFFDKNAWAVEAARRFPRRVHILHHVDQLVPGARSGLSGLRSNLLRWLVGRDGHADAAYIVHTPNAEAALSEVLGRERILRVGYPVDPPEALDGVAPPDSGPPILGFVGGAREEKGLDLLADAAQAMREPVTVRVIGPQPDGTLQRFEGRFGSVPVEWRPEELSVAELRAEMRRCHLAVLPYRKSFGLYGGSSASLLDALAAAVPLVVSPSIADQMPVGYGSVVADESESVEALTAAIEAALQSRTDLVAKAEAVGPDFIRRHHSAAGYVDRLGEAASQTG